MTDRVDVDALLRSFPVPLTWARTFMWGPWFWANSEDGTRTGPAWLPSWDDVQVFLLEGLDR